jgi:hypothetical protein
MNSNYRLCREPGDATKQPHVGALTQLLSEATRQMIGTPSALPDFAAMTVYFGYSRNGLSPAPGPQAEERGDIALRVRFVRAEGPGSVSDRHYVSDDSPTRGCHATLHAGEVMRRSV